MRQVTFNTGRLYGENGQRISAEVHSQWVAFVDKDRMIDGIIHGQFSRFTGEDGDLYDLKSRIMAAYDNSLYVYPQGKEQSEAIARCARAKT